MTTLTLEKPRLMTGEEFFNLPNNDLLELVEGEVRSMNAPGLEHGYLEMQIGRLLGNFVYPRKIGWVFGGETGVYVHRNPDSIRGVDVAFISRERLPKRPTRGYLEIAPELIVEIVSPNDRWREINKKIAEYFAIGVDEVWIVNPTDKDVRRYTSPLEVENYENDESVAGRGKLAGFSLNLMDLFADDV